MVARRSTGSTVVAVLLVIGLSGCGASTPTCDEATGLIDAGQLHQAAEGYALARERGEGGCAEAGLDRAGNRFQDAYVDVARGRLAEERGDVDAAVAAYRAALFADADNPAAVAALGRLEQPVPHLREPVPPVPEPPTLSPLPTPVVWLVVAIAALLVVLVGLVAVALRRWQSWVTSRTSEQKESRAHITTAVSKIEPALTKQMRTVAADTSAAIETTIANGIAIFHDETRSREQALDTVIATVGTVRRELAATRTALDDMAARHANELDERLDELTGVLAAVLAGGGRPTVHRYRATGG